MHTAYSALHIHCSRARAVDYLLQHRLVFNEPGSDSLFPLLFSEFVLLKNSLIGNKKNKTATMMIIQ